MRIAIRLVPGKDALRSVLLAVVSVAAVSLGQFWAAALVPQAGALQSLVGGLIAGGLTVVGSLLVNSLIPATTTDMERSNTYAISGWRNQIRQGAPIPLPMGRIRYAPPFAATSYTEIIGDTQYVRALFCFGYGPLNISDMRLGDTPLSEFDEVEIETREGRDTDNPVTLYPRQVVEDAGNVELFRPLPRDDAGELTGGASIETPVVRYTASQTEKASVIIGFPGGLFAIDGDGNVQNRTVAIRIRQQLEGGSGWSSVTTLNLTAAKREAFFRQYTWTLPSRGRWQIEVTRMTDEATSTQVSDRSVLSAVQSIRPEYPVAMNKAMALVALRVKATLQLNGGLEEFNAVVQRYGQTWDGTAWSEAMTRNPASAYLTALQSPANPFPAADTGIDIDQIADWFDFCANKGLRYDRVHDEPESFGQMLQAICGAGRASPRHDGLKWGVVIDRPQTVAVDHVSPRNSSDFQWSRTYFDAPDGFRVTFQDETNGWEQAERIVPWPGHIGPIDLTESLELPGKTDPDEIWIEARRRMHELTLRPDRFQAIQDGAARVATRGDLVMGSFDTLDTTQIAARVLTASGRLVELDDPVTMEDGKSYGLRFRQFADGNDVVGSSVMAGVITRAGTGRTLLLDAADRVPAVGELVHFGETATESIPLRIRGIEPGEDLSTVLHMVAAAPEIDVLTDAETPPAWNGIVGAEIDLSALVPATPVFSRIVSGADTQLGPNIVQFLLSPGTGSTAEVVTFEIDHMLATSGIWTTSTIPVADGGGTLDIYNVDDVIEIRARGVTSDSTGGPYTATISHTVGSGAVAIPDALDNGAIAVTGGLGNTRVVIATPNDSALAQIQIYRVPAGDTMNRDQHAAGDPIQVSLTTTVEHVDGDGTRINALTDPAFDDSGAWTAGAGWTVSQGKASHTSGMAGALTQLQSFVSGKHYRLAFDVSGSSAGTVTPKLYGASDRPGTAVSANGRAYDRIQAVTGNDAFGWQASATFDGSIDDAVLFEETAACIDQGDWDYYLEPQNVAGVPGPVSGPFSTSVI